MKRPCTLRQHLMGMTNDEIPNDEIPNDEIPNDEIPNDECNDEAPVPNSRAIKGRRGSLPDRLCRTRFPFVMG